jgi:hypothetical protein
MFPIPDFVLELETLIHTIIPGADPGGGGGSGLQPPQMVPVPLKLCELPGVQEHWFTYIIAKSMIVSLVCSQ